MSSDERVNITMENIEDFRLAYAVNIGTAVLARPKDQPESEYRMVEGSTLNTGPFVSDTGIDRIFAAALVMLIGRYESRTDPEFNKNLVSNLKSFVTALEVVDTPGNTEIRAPTLVDENGTPLDIGLMLPTNAVEAESTDA